MHYGHAARQPHHLMPVPRPPPAGLTFDATDLFVALWVFV